MQHAIKLITATLAVAGAIGVAHAQGGGSGTPAAGDGTPGSGTAVSPTNSSATNTGNAADAGPGVRSSPDTSGTAKVKKTPVKHSHLKHAVTQDNSSSAVPQSKLPAPGN